MVLSGAAAVVRLLFVGVLVLVVEVDVKTLGSPRLVMVSPEEGGHGWVHRHGWGTALREGVLLGREVRVPVVVGAGVSVNAQRHSTSFGSD